MRGIARLCGHPRYATPLALIKRAHSSKVSIGVASGHRRPNSRVVAIALSPLRYPEPLTGRWAKARDKAASTEPDRRGHEIRVRYPLFGTIDEDYFLAAISDVK
jgi:hypothetical protein